MGLPHAFINIYQELQKKLVHQFSTNRHRKMSTTSLFNICQGPSESLRDYLVRFNENTIRVIPPNQEMFTGVFHSGLNEGYFNESPAKKSSLLLAEVLTRAECYIKGKGSHAKNKAHNVNEHVPNVEGSHH